MHACLSRLPALSFLSFIRLLSVLFSSLFLPVTYGLDEFILYIGYVLCGIHMGWNFICTRFDRAPLIDSQSHVVLMHVHPTVSQCHHRTFWHLVNLLCTSWHVVDRPSYGPAIMQGVEVRRRVRTDRKGEERNTRKKPKVSRRRGSK